MVITRKEVKTAVGVVTITATRYPGSVRYSASVEINGKVLARDALISNCELLHHRSDPDIEQYLLHGLALEAFKEIK